jgi:hypothetical protein
MISVNKGPIKADANYDRRWIAAIGVFPCYFAPDFEQFAPNSFSGLHPLPIITHT